jgi:hypothetical protein
MMTRIEQLSKQKDMQRLKQMTSSAAAVGGEDTAPKKKTRAAAAASAPSKVLSPQLHTSISATHCAPLPVQLSSSI